MVQHVMLAHLTCNVFLVIRETKHRFNELNMAIEQVKLAANLVLHSHDI